MFGVDGMNHVLNILYFQMFGFMLDNNSLLLPNVPELVSGQERCLAMYCLYLLRPPSQPTLSFFHPSPCQVPTGSSHLLGVEGTLAVGMGGSAGCGLEL